MLYKQSFFNLFRLIIYRYYHIWLLSFTFKYPITKYKGQLRRTGYFPRPEYSQFSLVTDL